MKAIKNFIFWVLYVLLSIVKAPFGLLGWFLLWIEKVHVSMLVELTKWKDDAEATEVVNNLLEIDAAGMKSLGERWYLDMKIES